MKNEVIKTFDAMATLDEGYKNANPDQGFGSLGEWPPEGEHDCYITKVSVDTNPFRQKDGQQFPGIRVQFEYQLVEDENHADPLQWTGAPFDLPVDPSKLTDEGARTRSSIELQRLAGHTKCLLRRNPTTLRTDLTELEKLLNSADKVVAARVRCQYRPVGNRTFKTEYLQQLLDS